MANAEALLDSDWLQWSATLLRAVGANQPEEEAAALRAQLYSFASHVLLRDMMSSDRQRCRTPTSPSQGHISVSDLCVTPLCTSPYMPSYALFGHTPSHVTLHPSHPLQVPPL